MFNDLPVIPPLDASRFGQTGADFIDDMNPHTGQWFEIHILATSVMEELIDPTISVNGAPPAKTPAGTTLAGKTFAAGVILYGRFTTIQQQAPAGKLIAYRVAGA